MLRRSGAGLRRGAAQRAGRRAVAPGEEPGAAHGTWPGAGRWVALLHWSILHDAGFDSAPRREGPAWKQFLTAQARGIVAADFVHVDTILLQRIYALIVIEHGTCRVHLAGITVNPDGAWITQAARNFLVDVGQRGLQSGGGDLRAG